MKIYGGLEVDDKAQNVIHTDSFVKENTEYSGRIYVLIQD
jgi:hypothetical protein